jgi:predicted ATP-dependent protease
MKHLMLRPDVIEAVRDRKFHIYAVSNIDEGIEILTGVEAGEADQEGNYPENTINYAVQTNLKQLADRVQVFSQPEKAAQNGRSSVKEVA